MKEAYCRQIQITRVSILFHHLLMLLFVLVFIIIRKQFLHLTHIQISNLNVSIIFKFKHISTKRHAYTHSQCLHHTCQFRQTSKRDIIWFYLYFVLSLKLQWFLSLRVFPIMSIKVPHFCIFYASLNHDLFI